MPTKSQGFSFERRARSRPKPISQIKLEQDLEMKRREEEVDNAKQFVANKVNLYCILDVAGIASLVHNRMSLVLLGSEPDGLHASYDVCAVDHGQQHAGRGAGFMSRQCAIPPPAVHRGAFITSCSCVSSSHLCIRTTCVSGLASFVCGIAHMRSLRMGSFRFLTQAQGNLTDYTTKICMKRTKRRKLGWRRGRKNLSLCLLLEE